MEEQPRPYQQQQQQQQHPHHHPPPPSSSSSSSSSSPAPPPPSHQHHHHQHHHHHHYYYYNHNRHQHHQQYQGEGGKAPPAAPKHEPKAGGGGGGGGGGAPPPPQEAPRKKAGYGELNGSVVDRDSPSLRVDMSGPISRVPNGSQNPGEANLTIKPSVKGSPFGKPGLKPKSFVPKAGTDKKAEKGYESKREPSEKSEALSIPNGVVTNASGYITNGYVGKGADNDGSGSESGYTTPKKRKGRRNSAKGCENLHLVQEKIVLNEPLLVSPASKQEPDDLRPECGEAKAAGASRADTLKPAWKCEPGGLGAPRGKPGLGGEVPRKNSEAKVGVASKKFEERPKGKPAASASKEDSWTLFKPPPVFPVDNSSAKIVPKISYASKVKENLNKAAQNPALPLSSSSSSSSSSLCLSSSTDVQTQPSARLSQVPMSAMKSVTSASFANGPVLAAGDRGACLAGAPSLFVPAAGGVLLTSSELASQDGNPTSGAVEPPKTSLLIYPANMQALLSAVSTTQAESPFQGNQQSLGDIFENQWGLSFINEPSAGPEVGTRKPADAKRLAASAAVLPGDCPAALASQRADSAPPSRPEQPVFPKAYELDKRTTPQLLSGLLKLGAAGEGGGFLLDPHPPLPGGSRAASDPGGPGGFVFLGKDCHVAESRLASLTNSLPVPAKDPRPPQGLEQKGRWSHFDQQAAVLYHTQEMESICNLQKQDPKRIITYNEAMDCPNQ